MKIRYGLTALSLSGLMLAMTACSYVKGYPDTDTVEFLYGGFIRETSVEEFAEDFYDMAELKDVVMESVNAYNEGHDNAVSIDLYDVKGRTVRLVMTYRDIASYEEFNTQPLLVKSAEEIAEGIAEDTLFYQVGEDLSLKETEGEPEMTGLTLYVITQPVDVITPGIIEYVSGDIEITGSSSCRTGESISEKCPAYIAARSS